MGRVFPSISPGQLIVCRYEEWLNDGVATVCMAAHGSFSKDLPQALLQAFFIVMYLEYLFK